jgi:hypothetical protein
MPLPAYVRSVLYQAPAVLALARVPLGDEPEREAEIAAVQQSPEAKAGGEAVSPDDLCREIGLCAGGTFFLAGRRRGRS